MQVAIVAASGSVALLSDAIHNVADGLHARTDGFTSLAVVVGAAGVALGWQPGQKVTYR